MLYLLIFVDRNVFIYRYVNVIEQKKKIDKGNKHEYSM